MGRVDLREGDGHEAKPFTEEKIIGVLREHADEGLSRGAYVGKNNRIYHSIPRRENQALYAKCAAVARRALRSAATHRSGNGHP
jgi:hypothetical protein